MVNQAAANAEHPAAVDRADWLDVEAARSGDGEAYGRIVRRHQQAVAAWMWRFTRDRGQWEELVHDVFVEAYLSVGTFRGRSSLGHWLRTIATRVGYRWWKERARQRLRASRSFDEALDLAGDEGRDPSAEEAAAAVHAVLERMSVRDRLVLTLMYLEECSVAETARLTGWSQTMVKVQAHRARGRLKKLLQQGRTER